MKNMHRCPKCAGKKIWVVEKYRAPDDNAATGRTLPVVTHQAPAKTGLFQVARIHPVGHFDLYLCAACGYSELWAAGFEELVPDEARGIRMIDTSNLKDGPFR